MEDFFLSIRAARNPRALLDFQSKELPTQDNKSQMTAVSCDKNGSCISICLLVSVCLYLSSAPKILNTENFTTSIHLTKLPVIFRKKWVQMHRHLQQGQQRQQKICTHVFLITYFLKIICRTQNNAILLRKPLNGKIIENI